MFSIAFGWAQPTQQQTPPLTFGSLSGHVYCADTNAPARFARVTIERAEDFEDIDRDAKAAAVSAHIPSANIVETDLDGSFSIEDVVPGRYYVLVEMPGYLSPLAMLPPDNVSLTSDEDKKKIRSILRQVTVVGNQTSQLDFRLVKGAALSGRILYDDGSPVVAAPLSLFRKEKDGTWKETSNGLQDRFPGQRTTDDLGRYRIAALSPAEYVVSVDLRRVTVSVIGSFLGVQGFNGRGAAEPVHVYSGNTTRRRDAKPFALTEGEDRSGADIIVPISKLHSLSGTIVAEEDGHPLSSGLILLLDAFDRSTVNEAWVQFADGRFKMEFVPEGDYVLKISSATDSVRETGSIQGSQNGTFTRLRPVRNYVDAEQPLAVNGNLSGIVVKMMEKEADADQPKPGASEPDL
jgi:hypothetical protein